MKLNKQERAFDLQPLGIKYICEFCNEGEMIVDHNKSVIVPYGNASPMITHKCNKCGKTMELPKSYPYIEWITEDEYYEWKMNKERVNDSTEVHMDN